MTQPGDIGVGAANYQFGLIVRCPVCDKIIVIPLNKELHNITWQFNESNLTLQPSVRTETSRGICHWSLTKGKFILYMDSTAIPNDVAEGVNENFS